MTYEEIQRLWMGGCDTIPAHSSGSTGKPRSILLPRVTVERSAWRTLKFFNITSASHLHSCIAPDFIGGKMVLIRALLAKCQFSHETPSNKPLGDFGPGDTIDMVSVVPSQMLNILERFNNGTLPEIRDILIGGSAIPDGLRQAIAASGLNAWESYGMTETASHVAVRRIIYSPQPFTPLPGITVSADSRGCLVIDLDSGEHIVTNDLAEFDTQDRFTIIGRADNVIVSGGRKIIPEEVERLLGLPSDCVMISSLPDSKWGERMVAAVAAGMNDTVTEAAANIEPGWMRPKQIIEFDSLPHTPNGKPDRPALRRLLNGKR